LVFTSRRKGLQKLLENAFEILEKEKKKWKISFHSPLWLSAFRPSPRLAASRRPLLPTLLSRPARLKPLA
jgi:hypothetical protein